MVINLKQNVLELEFDQKIDYTIISSYNDIIHSLKSIKFQILELNFQSTRFITSPGAMYILFITSSIINYKKRNSEYVETRISNYSENILNAIANFGLISILKFYGNLKIDNTIEEINEKKYNYWKRSVRNSNHKLDTLYWPISIIPIKSNDNFETDLSTFINGFVDYFNMLTRNQMIDYFGEIDIEYARKDFIRAVNEAVKNVWDHSESWGAASIFSSKSNKTTFCLFDYGIGFINSYSKRKGSFERTSNSDIEILKWLFKEGNTSDDENNHGRGLPRIAKFVERTNGVLLIKTDKYMLQYNVKNGLKIVESEFYPGTQIMINF